MIDRDLRLGFRAMIGGIIGPDQLREALTECLRDDETTLEDVLERRGWASSVQIDDLDTSATATDSDPPPTDEPTAAYPGDSTGSTAPIAERTTQVGSKDGPRSGPSDRAIAGGRYQRLRLHATGGLGRVWLARDLHLGREVALKELRVDRSVDPNPGPSVLRGGPDHREPRASRDRPAL